MELLNKLFTFTSIFKLGGIIFSFLFLILTIQMNANVSQVVHTVETKRNWAFVLISRLLVFTSIILLILGFAIL